MSDTKTDRAIVETPRKSAGYPKELLKLLTAADAACEAAFLACHKYRDDSYHHTWHDHAREIAAGASNAYSQINNTLNNAKKPQA